VTTLIPSAVTRRATGRVSRRHVLIGGAVALAVVLLAAAAVIVAHRAPSVDTAMAGAGPVQESAGGLGEVTVPPNRIFSLSSNIFFPVGPVTVTKVDVLPGSVVRAGAPLVALDATSVNGSAGEVQAQITADNASLALATSASSGVASQTDAADLRSQIALLQSELTLAQGNVATITSPISGKVSSVSAQVGAVATAGRELVQVVDDSVLQVSFGVQLDDLSSVAVGEHATVSFPGLPGSSVQGRVVTISAKASNAGLDGTVVVQSPNLPGTPVPLGAEADVAVNKVVHAPVVVPAIAVLDQELAPYVYVVEHDHVVMRRVTIGALGTDDIEVLSGLRAGTEVAESDLQALTTGMKVRPSGHA
jgi:multidrug efflux system membrane fusion protein